MKYFIEFSMRWKVSSGCVVRVGVTLCTEGVLLVLSKIIDVSSLQCICS